MSCSSYISNSCWRRAEKGGHCATCQMVKNEDDLKVFLEYIPTMKKADIYTEFQKYKNILKSDTKVKILLEIYKQDKELCKRVVGEVSLLFEIQNHTSGLCPIFSLLVNTTTVFPKKCIRCIEQCIQHKKWIYPILYFFTDSVEYKKLLNRVLKTPNGLERCRNLVERLRDTGYSIHRITETYPELQSKDDFTDKHMRSIEKRTAIWKDELIETAWHPSRIPWILTEDEKGEVSRYFNTRI